jgi:hypothetical protein
MTTPPPKLLGKNREAPATVEIPDYKPFSSAETLDCSPTVMAALIAQTRPPNERKTLPMKPVGKAPASTGRRSGSKETTRLGKRSSRIADGSESSPTLLHYRQEPAAEVAVEEVLAAPLSRPVARSTSWRRRLGWIIAGGLGTCAGLAAHQVVSDPFMRILASAALVPITALLVVAMTSTALGRARVPRWFALPVTMAGSVLTVAGGALIWLQIVEGGLTLQSLPGAFAAKLSAMTGLPPDHVWLWWGVQAAAIVVISLAWSRERLDESPS